MHALFAKLRLFSRNARLVLVASFLTGLALGGYRLLFNFYALSLGDTYNEAFIGTLQTMQSLAGILIALPVAYIAGRYPHKRLLLLANVTVSLSILGIVLLPMQWSLVLFRMLFGMTIAAREVVVAPFLLDNTSADERQWVFSYNLGLTVTATFVGNTLGGSLPTLFGNLLGIAPTSTLAYQLAIGALGFVAALTVLPLLALRPSEGAETIVEELPWNLLREHGRTLIPFFIPQIIIGLGAGLMQPFMNIYFRNVYAQPDPIIGWVFAFGGISMAIAQFIAPPLADARGKMPVVALSQFLSIPFLLLLAAGAYLVPAGIVGAGVWFIVAGIAYNARLGLMNMGNPVYQTFMLEQVPDNVSALAVSLTSISFQFGWFIMPQFSGWLQVRFDEFGFVPIFSLVAVFYLIAIITEFTFFRDHMRRPKRKPKSEPAASSE